MDLHVAPGDRVCLVGRNGSGKTTLLRIAAGEVAPDEGTVFLQPGARAACLPQEPDLSGHPTVRAYVDDGLPAEVRADAHRVDAVLDDLGLDGDRPTAGLSGGEQRRAALARALAGDPQVLLLDEPTNHLDLPTIERLEARLAAHRGALVVISHDRRFLEGLTNRVAWLDRGRLRLRDGGFDGFDAWSDEVLAREEAEQARLADRIARESAWARRGIPARRKRNQGRLRQLEAMRAERAAWRRQAGVAALAADAGGASGKIVIEAERLVKAYGERTVLDGVSLRVLRGDRLGLVGPNGAGKTTLLRLLTGDLAPDRGTVRHGTRLETVYVDQLRAALDPERTLQETLCDAGPDHVMVRGRPVHVAAYLRDFLFDARQARTPVGTLSGGERNRLLLARTLARPANLLVLDEPTNDLDMETLDLLQEVLADYEGTLLLVSHDRDFLDRVATSVVMLEGDGRATEYAGGYRDAMRQRALAEEAARRAADVPASRAPAAAETRAPRARTKLSYKETRELEALPAALAALQAEIEAARALLDDGEAWARDPAAYEATAARLEAAREELAAAEERWLELEVLREELEAARREGP